MKSTILFIISVFCLSVTCFGQQDSTWQHWNWLIGEWVGEGSGKPGQGSGSFSIKPDLDNKILVRKNHAEYPATEKNPKIIHDDLMVVYLDGKAHPSKAIYFDNEGHTINYSIDYSEGTIILISDKIPDRPIFRLTYTSFGNETINVKFEMSLDGQKFTTYTEGKCVKKR